MRELPTLFLEFRGSQHADLRRDFDAISAIAARHGCLSEHQRFAASGHELDEIWEACRGCYFAAAMYRGKRGNRLWTGDVCVPVPHLAECVADAEAEVRLNGFKPVICAHIADGNFNCVVPHQPNEREAVQKIEQRLVDCALHLGGAVTGEHGVGIGKVHHSCIEHCQVHIAVQQVVKKALDPLGIMNPGKVLLMESAPTER